MALTKDDIRRAARTCARARSGGAGGIVCSPDWDPKRRHDSGRLWSVWYGQLLLRL